jgi:hypothetical protein
MKICSSCKYSFPYEHNHTWNDEMQKAYEEEVASNKALFEDTESWAYKPYPRFFWHDIKAAYDTEEDKKASHIFCKCMPTYAQRRKDDSCGQWKQWCA